MEFFGKATEAKKQTEVGEEKEGIRLASMNAQISNDGHSGLNRENFQKAIDEQFGKNRALIDDNGDGTFIVTFIKSNNM